MKKIILLLLLFQSISCTSSRISEIDGIDEFIQRLNTNQNYSYRIQINDIVEDQTYRVWLKELEYKNHEFIGKFSSSSKAYQIFDKKDKYRVKRSDVQKLLIIENKSGQDIFKRIKKEEITRK